MLALDRVCGRMITIGSGIIEASREKWREHFISTKSLASCGHRSGCRPCIDLDPTRKRAIAGRPDGASVPNQTQIGQSGGTMNDDLQYGTFGHGVEREQANAYQVFLRERDPARKIRLGNDFLKKYPK